jgi:hypothetical protein
MLPEDRSLLECNSKVDVIVLLDGSASLGQLGWASTLAFGEKLIGALEGGDEKAWVALQVFSRSVEWPTHFTNDTAKVSALVKDVKWPMSVTYTHEALLQAESELIHGREDAMTVVVVVTDGWPSYIQKTKDAAESLKQKARILWVPVGTGAPIDMIKELASVPKAENIVEISNFEDMTKPAMINKIISDACPSIS